MERTCRHLIIGFRFRNAASAPVSSTMRMRLVAKIEACRQPASSVSRRRDARSSTRIAAARRSGPRTRSRRSITAWRSAPTASSSTSTCRATAWSSCIMTRRSSARRTRSGPWRDHTADELARVDAGYRFQSRSRRRRRFPFRGRGSAFRRCATVLRALSGRAAHHRARRRAERRSWRATDGRRGPRGAARSSASRSARSAGARCAPRGARARHCDRRRARRDAVGALSLVGAAGRSAGRLSGVPGARTSGRDDGRHAAVRRARPPAGVCRCKVWTVDEARRTWTRLLDWGVDGDHQRSARLAGRMGRERR